MKRRVNPIVAAFAAWSNKRQLLSSAERNDPDFGQLELFYMMPVVKTSPWKRRLAFLGFILVIGMTLAMWATTSHGEEFTITSGMVCDTPDQVRQYLATDEVPDGCGIYVGAPITVETWPIEEFSTPTGTATIMSFDPVQPGLDVKYGFVPSVSFSI
jgi:hypothetical protein